MRANNLLPNWLDLPRPIVILAPMAGVADFAFRELCYRHGAEVTFSPLVAAHGLVASPKSVLPTVGARHGARPFVAQLFGHDPQHFRIAARILTDAFPLSGIDINMGCPTSLVVGSGNGSALLKSPDLAADIVAATVAGTSLPVSVKIRTGWETVTAPDLAPRLVSAGASALTVHGRTREQQYSGDVDYATIAAVKSLVSVPVIGNGNVTSVEAANRMLATGVDGIMIGRGALGRPWVFAGIVEDLKPKSWFSTSEVDRIAVVREHIALSFEDEGDMAALTIRKHLMAYSRGLVGGVALRRLVQHLHGRREVDDWANQYAAIVSGMADHSTSIERNDRGSQVR